MLLVIATQPVSSAKAHPMSNHCRASAQIAHYLPVASCAVQLAARWRPSILEMDVCDAEDSVQVCATVHM